MPLISKRACQLKKAREVQAEKLKAKKNEMEVGQDNDLELTTITKEQYALYTTIDTLSETEVKKNK